VVSNILIWFLSSWPWIGTSGTEKAARKAAFSFLDAALTPHPSRGNSDQPANVKVRDFVGMDLVVDELCIGLEYERRIVDREGDVYGHLFKPDDRAAAAIDELFGGK
jgi:hypothetical protein